MRASGKQLCGWIGLPGLAALLLFGVFYAGGTRSNDGEIMFRIGYELQQNGRFGADHPLEHWPKFGMPQGKDGLYYSVFGPLQSILLVPVIAVAKPINDTGWYQGRRLPGGLSQNATKTPETWSLRLLGGVYNLIIGALCVMAMIALVWRITDCPQAGLFAGMLLGAGTPLLHYSGAMFSEPLSMLLLILCMHQAAIYEDAQGAASAYPRLALGGLLLGLALTNHVTAVLFIPFFGLHVLWCFYRGTTPLPSALKAAAVYSLPLVCMMVLLGYYNYARFGSPFETGRTADPQMVYATWVSPVEGLVGLIFSWGKSLFLFVPAVVVGICCWSHLHKRLKGLSIALAAACLVRLLICSARGDWHGGFSLGPRLMMQTVPMLLLPLGLAFAAWYRKASRGAMWGAVSMLILCTWEQFYLALGDIFTFYQRMWMMAARQGYNSFPNSFFNEPFLTPLYNILEGRRGSWFLQSVHLSNGQLWWLLNGIAALVIVAVMYKIIAGSGKARTATADA